MAQHKTTLFVLMATLFGMSGCQQPVQSNTLRSDAGNSALPPNPRPGECYARVNIPPSYQMVSEQRVISEASETIAVTPEEYTWVDDRVVSKEASTRLEHVPAEYSEVEERVMVKPAGTRLKTIRATHKYVEERVLVKEAYTGWKKGRGSNQRVDGATGEIMCLVEYPAEYKTVRKRIIDRPAQVREIAIPAEYQTIRKRVLVKPATVREIHVPEEYKTIRVRRLKSPATTTRNTIPAKYETVERRVQTSDGRTEWRRVLCETNATSAVVSRIQDALRRRGYFPGRTGRLDSRTYSAIRRYQQDESLVSGPLTYDTIRSLGVTPP